MIRSLQVDFPKLNGPTHYSGRDLKELVATFFVLFLAVGSRDLMYYVATSFFATSSFSCCDLVSLSRLKLLPIRLILVVTKFFVAT